MREWLAGRLGVTNDTASSLKRLAHSEHHDVRRMAGRGELSFDQAVEADRLAALVGENRAIEAAVTHDIAGMRRLTSRHRRITPGDERDIFDGRHFVMQTQPRPHRLGRGDCCPESTVRSSRKHCSNGPTSSRPDPTARGVQSASAWPTPW